MFYYNCFVSHRAVPEVNKKADFERTVHDGRSQEWTMRKHLQKNKMCIYDKLFNVLLHAACIQK